MYDENVGTAEGGLWRFDQLDASLKLYITRNLNGGETWGILEDFFQNKLGR